VMRIPGDHHSCQPRHADNLPSPLALRQGKIGIVSPEFPIVSPELPRNWAYLNLPPKWQSTADGRDSGIGIREPASGIRSSRLVARGSPLVARGSRLVARGSPPRHVL